jgi:dinuclear metal center YbgI/SA1388 family protein
VRTRFEIEQYLKELFRPEIFDDYCPNGLQIEGKQEIKKIAFAVSATRESVEKAVHYNADMLIVHHGLFWKFHGTRTITGPFAKRITPLIKNDINLIGMHLPLDGHQEIGNAATIAQLLNLQNLLPFGTYKGVATGIKGEFSTPIKPLALKLQLEKILQHPILYSAPMDSDEPISNIGIITGGANGDWKEAGKLGLQSYLTGEMSEHDYHESREAGIHMFAGGHHATEKFGIQNLMHVMHKKYSDLECAFFDSENPA